MRDKKKYDIMTIWVPLIGATIMVVAVFIICMNLDNDYYSQWGSRLYEPGFVGLLEVICFIGMFFILRSSGKKAAKKQMLKMTDQ